MARQVVASKVAKDIFVWYPFTLHCLGENGFNNLSAELFKNVQAKQMGWSESC